MLVKKTAATRSATAKTTTKGETGHSKNVSNFERLVSECNGLGAKYNPSQNELMLANLQTMQMDGETVIANVTTAETDMGNDVHGRANVFADLKPFCTRIVGAFNACKIPDNVKYSASSILKQIRGTRIKPIKEKVVTIKEGDEPTPVPVTVSAVQQSYDSLVVHFTDLINLLLSRSEYNPNEIELKVTSLQDKLTGLRLANTAVINANTNIGNTRIARNKFLYAKDTGLVDTALSVKSYVLSVFNASSPEYKKLNKIPFKTIKS